MAKTRSQLAKRYQNTLRTIKAKHGVDHRTAQAAYRKLKEALGSASLSRNDISKHPIYTKRAIRGAEKEVRVKSRIQRERETSKLSSAKAIEQAIAELEGTAPNLRSSITERFYDSDSMLVKITIKGKDYTRKITGRIADRKGSKILQWKWSAETTGKRPKYRRRRR